MSPERRVYLLDPQRLPPETIAVTFAKTSRSPQTFAEIAAELSDEKSAEFHEKWVVGYGHASVAEHAVLHIAVENLSRLAVECLESNRLASYTEKSTRYQKWGMDDFIIPDEVQNSLFLEEYLSTIRTLLDAYQQSLPLVRQVIAMDHPRQPEESEAAWERRIRSDYIDVSRYFLPAACLANVGVTINARALEHAITKMLSHPLAEVRAVGEEIKKAARASVPTLVKYAEPSAYLVNSTDELTKWGTLFIKNITSTSEWCSCTWADEDLESRLLAACLLPHLPQGVPFSQIHQQVREASPAERQTLARAALASLGRFDIPRRELEHAAFSFEVILDQGAYFELKRHRMLTQSIQNFSPELGFAIPSAITRAGLESTFIEKMQVAATTFQHLTALSPQVASYVLPNAFNRRVLLTLNFRSAMHLVALRSAPNAHFAMRRVAQRMAEEIRLHFPILGDYLHTYPAETWQGIEKQFFTNPNFLSPKGLTN